jgi:hypothetical protein
MEVGCGESFLGPSANGIAFTEFLGGQDCAPGKQASPARASGLRPDRPSARPLPGPTANHTTDRPSRLLNLPNTRPTKETFDPVGYERCGPHCT